MDYRQMIGFVTGKPSRHPFPAHMQQGRQIAEEGMVLLRNEGGVLPLKEKKAALFGAGAVDTITCGTGSGFVFAPYTVNVRKGLENAGIQITSTGWLDRFEKESRRVNKEDKTISRISRIWSGLSILIEEPEITEEDLAAAAGADTCLYVIRRSAGEGKDRDAGKGDYLLSDRERANLEKAAAAFAHTVVILNTCVIDASFLNEIPGIDACVLMGLAGNEAGNALADLLTGKASFSGRLTDTWAVRYEDNPAAKTFGANDGDSLQEDYTEDIYVGYRGFETFGVKPLFPFGFGLSCTAFETSLKGISADWEQIRMDVSVTNTGKTGGKEVVQVYVTAPSGKLDKPLRELKGFAKTKNLAPGETQVLTVEIPTKSLASYDEELASFVMEKGTYLLCLGKNAADTECIASLVLDADAVTARLSNRLTPDHPLERKRAPRRADETAPTGPVVKLHAADCKAEAPDYSDAPKTPAEPAPESTLPDVAEGRVSLEAFVNSLDEEVLFRLVAGSADEVPHSVPARSLPCKCRPVKGPSSSGSTTSLYVKSLGIPNWLVTDGPAGCHLPLCGATGYPAGIVIAQTWNPEMAYLSGEGIGKELAYYHYSIILGPGLNIHRDPLCGRAFEYFSEDPLISGRMAAAITKGVQATEGAGVSIKHFACNSQEADRLDTNATVSERALREIYLRGFEICVKEADPKIVMTSYNKINGVHTSSSKDLVTDILRKEWGFKGLVMTDWGTHSDKAADLAAGNDLIMGGYRSSFLKAALHGLSPEFSDDGYVHEEDFKVFGGFFTNHVEFWNAFEPGKDGPDTVETTVPAGTQVSEKARQKAAEGIAEIRENADGSTTVCYHGTNRGATLSLEDLRTCAGRTLAQLIHSRSYLLMTGKA